MFFSDRLHLSQLRQQWVIRYGASLAATATALGIWFMWPAMHQTPFVIFIAAVIVSARFFGFGPALLCTIASALALDYFVFASFHLSLNLSPSDSERLVVFVLVSLLAAGLARQRTQAETRAIETRQRMAAIVESCQDAIMGMTLNGAIVSWNAGAEALFGYSESAIIGRPVEAVIPAYRSGKLSEMYRRLQCDELIDRFETLGQRQDGSSFELALTHSPLKDSHGQIIGASVLARDISQRKRQDAERLQLIQELTEALARVKTLSGLLPICASCKKIRDDKGYWQQVETYIRQRSEADFTHGICPDCAERLYPEFKMKTRAVSAAAA